MITQQTKESCKELIGACKLAIHKLEQTIQGQYPEGQALNTALTALTAAIASLKHENQLYTYTITWKFAESQQTYTSIFVAYTAYHALSLLDQDVIVVRIEIAPYEDS